MRRWGVKRRTLSDYELERDEYYPPRERRELESRIMVLLFPREYRNTQTKRKRSHTRGSERTVTEMHVWHTLQGRRGRRQRMNARRDGGGRLWETTHAVSATHSIMYRISRSAMVREVLRMNPALAVSDQRNRRVQREVPQNETLLTFRIADAPDEGTTGARAR